jgi:hypothetical protein
MMGAKPRDSSLTMVDRAAYSEKNNELKSNDYATMNGALGDGRVPAGNGGQVWTDKELSRESDRSPV